MIIGLSDKLKQKRQALGLSRKVVSEIIGISASTLADYENGYIEPSLKNIMKLAALYKCSTDYLLGLEKQAPARCIDVSQLSDDQVQALQRLVDTMEGE